MPLKAENSASKDNNIAARAIDMRLDTWSRIEAGSDGRYWLKITMKDVECVQHVIWYDRYGNSRATWTCTKDDCSQQRERLPCRGAAATDRGDAGNTHPESTLVLQKVDIKRKERAQHHLVYRVLCFFGNRG